MSLSPKDAFNNYIVHTDTPACFPLWRAGLKNSTNPDSKKNEAYDSMRAEFQDTIDMQQKLYQEEVENLKKKIDTLERNLKVKEAIYREQQIKDIKRFEDEKTQLQKQLQQKQDEFNDLAVHFIVFKDEVDKYLSKNIDVTRMKNTLAFMNNPAFKIKTPGDFNPLIAMEKIYESLKKSREKLQD